MKELNGRKDLRTQLQSLCAKDLFVVVAGVLVVVVVLNSM